MYLQLSQDIILCSSDILGIFDMDNSTIAKSTRDFLYLAEREGRVITVSTELPKSFVVCETSEQCVIYLSQLTPITLYKRFNAAIC